MKYFDEAKKLWRAYVPESGQADTVQGELMRSIEKLRWEAQNNGNINWDKDFSLLADFIKKTLLAWDQFDTHAQKEIDNDIKVILDFRHPYVEDDVYDRLIDRIVEWSRTHPEPVAHELNKNLNR